MKKKNVLLVLTEDNEVLVTSFKEYNEEEGSKYKKDFSFPISIEDAKGYGNGNEDWERVLDEYGECELFEIEMSWGENAMIFVK